MPIATLQRRTSFFIFFIKTILLEKTYPNPKELREVISLSVRFLLREF